MKIGVLTTLSPNESIDKQFKKIKDMGFSVCQLTCWNIELLNKATADEILAAKAKHEVDISTFWCGWSGPQEWNFTEGPTTLGIVPAEYRELRTKELMRGSDFARLIGVAQMATHLGFIPENYTDPAFMPIVETVRKIAGKCKENCQYFLCEAGQETPVTLLRLIEESGCDNIGINFDTVNLVLYGKANSLDALDVFGRYVMDVHIKDGEYPTNGREIGKEKQVGKGRVDFPGIIRKLKALGYDATLTIEREIKGDEQTRDILETKRYLEGLI